MKIAVVGPSPVPYVYGGMEGLLWKLVESINDHSENQAELIKLPCKESSFWDLISSYHNFYNLDLSHFDMVISTKYPSWMIKHDNHIVYMIHHLRGLFDTYHFCNEQLDVPDSLRVGLVADILDLVQTGEPSEDRVNLVFNKLSDLKKDRINYNKNTFKFPGPFIRSIIHFFDEYALSAGRIRRYATMSNNVRERKDYFPANVEVDVIYPPSRIENFYCNTYDYLFTVSRLDSPKRIDKLIESMKYIPHNIKFKIAGVGPEEGRLKKLAESDKRIEFLGFVNEMVLVELYSNALAVLYIPYDEDYGLITIEAMMSKKPVITSKDSGGPLEFVRDFQTGYIVDANPETIAEKVNYLIEYRMNAEEMGSLAYQNVKEINWENFVHKLLGEAHSGVNNKKRILVLSTYSCYPPVGGGQQRLYNLYSRLAKTFDVTVCSIIEVNKMYQNLTLINGLRQLCLPQSREHAGYQWGIERKLGINLYDVCMIDFVETSPDYVQTVKELLINTDIIIFLHPYIYGIRKYIGDDKVVIYDSVDTEYLLKKDYVKDNEWVEKIRNIEQKACFESDMIFTTSVENKENLIDIYGPSPEKIAVIPNGVDVKKIEFIGKEDKLEQKNYLGLSRYPTILFVGSWHPPNLEALNLIVRGLSKNHKKYLYLVVGSVKDYYLQQEGILPENVLAFGEVSEDEKYEIYKLADIAINPMFSGSGTNIKMLDYMSAGIPVISTTVGARGLDVENYKHLIICGADQMSTCIDDLISNELLKEDLRKGGRLLVETKYSWEFISKRVVEIIKEAM